MRQNGLTGTFFKEKFKILVVDDDIVSRKKLVFFLIKIGFTVISAANGREGLDLWKKLRPKVVFTDWYMPEINGKELCKKIREIERQRDTRIIIVSAEDYGNFSLMVEESGADGYLVKPFDKKKLELLCLKMGI
ncbi:MAG: response regulator [Desulfobacterales bacterium]|nr:response regulator [Desulfobacterales bacterium]